MNLLTRVFFIVMTAVFVVIGVGAYGGTPRKVLIEYFFQPGCEECEKVSAFILPQLQEEFAGRYELCKYDVGIEKNFLKLAAYQERLKVDDNAPVCMIVDGKTYLGGYEQIDKKLYPAIEASLLGLGTAQSPEREASRREVLQKRAAKFTLATVVVGGLVDGVNPCVFSTLVFFLSLLAVSKVKGRKLLLTGGVYCLACFLAYLALGFGLFRFLKLFAGYSWLQLALEVTVLAVLAIFALLSFLDAWRYKMTGRVDAVRLQLPDTVKRRIHVIMRRGLAYRYLIPGAFGIGVLVTALESVCTGQVYVPMLVLLTREAGANSRWFGYLLLYNVMFIVPLLVLFGAAYKGTSTPKLLEWSRSNVVVSKIALGCFFIALGVVLLIF